MLKKVTALKIRQNLGQVMNEVAIKGDDYIVERAGKPMVVIIPIEKYKLFDKGKGEFFEWVDETRKRTKNVKVKAINDAVNKAVKAVKK